ncbi:DUF835 domain-containing protein [Thermococcus sp.]
MNFPDLFLGVALLVSYVLFFYTYHVTGRKASLYYSLAWLSLAVPVFSPDRGVHIVGLAFFSAFLWASNVEAINELSLTGETVRSLLYLSILPVLIVFLLYPEYEALAYVLLGLWIVLSSILLGFYGGSGLRLMSILQGFFGIFVILYGVGGFPGLLPVLLAVILAFESVRTLLGASFLGDFSIGSIKDVSIDEKPGLSMVPSVPEEVLSSALVFSRVPKNAPNWFWITNVRGERVVSPRNLPKILDMAVKFMREAKDAGKRPVVVIDCLEYLVLENGLSSVLKFLSALRDHALIHNAAVFIVGDDDFLSERERKLLRSIVGEGDARSR